VRGYLGNQGRNRPNKGPRHGNRDGNRGNMGNNGGRPDEMLHEQEPFDADDSEIISPAELTQSRSSMNLTELKSKPIHELVKLAESWAGEPRPLAQAGHHLLDPQGARAQRRNLRGRRAEILQDGFGFLRSADGPTSRVLTTLRQPQPDPPLQPAHRRHDLRAHPAAEGTGSATALLKVGELIFDS
jgi:transcription termination factor Rho